MRQPMTPPHQASKAGRQPTRLGALLVLGLLAAASGAAAQTPAPAWQIDAGHTFVHFEVVHMGTSTIRGRFDKVAGSVRFDKDARLLEVGITVETASVNTGFEPLDKILRGGQLFAVADNPQAWFVAKTARFEGEAVKEVQGEITLRGRSQPLTLRALRWKCGFNALYQREVCGGDFEASLKRSDFQMTLALPLVADEVRVIAQIEAIRQ